MAGVTRRGLLLAGGAGLLAGCGREDAAVPPPRAVDALRRQLAAERGAAAALADRDALRERALERARRLAVAVAEEGGRPHEAPQGTAAARAPEEALAAALAAHIAALPDLPRRRALLAGLIEGAAADLAVVDREAAPFPGSGT